MRDRKPMADGYYTKRAPEYERIYTKPERQQDLARLKCELRDLLRGERILELACGTGYWTEVLSATARSIVACDNSAAVLELARQKDYGGCDVSLRLGDAYQPQQIEGEFSAIFAGFWWSHVPLQDLNSFLSSLHARLGRGGKVVFIDNRYVPGSSTAISERDALGNTFQERILGDGSRHRIIKNFPDEAFLRQLLAGRSEAIEVRTFDYYWCLHYQVAPAWQSEPGVRLIV